MQIINQEEIENVFSMKEMIKVIEDYYLYDGEKKSFVPERLFVTDEKYDNTAILMPSFYENYYAAKSIGIAPENSKIGEPTLRGYITLFERNRMKPLALLDARTVTALRTGAISGVGMEYMSKKDASTVGLIGTGDQGWSHLQAACAVRDIKKVFVNNRSEERLNQFIEKAKKKYPELSFYSSSQEEILRKSDLIITTSTSVQPVLPELQSINLEGKHFAGSGAFKSHMQEIPDYIIEKADYIAVDSYAAFEECGEMKKAKSIGYSESNTMDTKKMVQNGKNDSMENGITIFKSVGIAILDILASKLIYEKSIN